MNIVKASGWETIKDAAGRAIYTGTSDACVRFLKYRNACKAAENLSPEWHKAKSRIDCGPGQLLFNEGGDIYGTHEA